MFKIPKIKNRRTSVVASFLAITVGAGIVSTAYAAQLEEIVVTARKTSENLQDVPIAVTAFTGEFFQDSGLVEFSDIGKLTPNFDIQEDATAGSLFSNITIRGQTALNRELSSDQAVGITINGAPVTRGTNLFSNLFDVEQVEVLKGPQGTLFGKNTTGGAVVVRTTTPKLNEVSGYVEADIGNFSRTDFEGVLNFGGDTWAVRLGAAVQERDGFQFGVRRDGAIAVTDDGITPSPSSVASPLPTVNAQLTDTTGFRTGSDYGNDDEEFFKASVLFQPNEELSIQVNADYHEVNELGQGTRVLNDGLIDLNILAPSVLPVPGIVFLPVAVQVLPEGGHFASSHQQLSLPSLIADETNINATISYDFEKVTLESITSFREQTALANNPFAGVAEVEVGQESDIFAQEIRLSGLALDGRLKWQSGGFYSDEEGIDIDNVGGFRRTASKNKTIAIFGQGTYAITDRLNFTGGLRYTEEDRGLALILSNIDPLVSQQDVSFDGTSWTAGLDYKLQEDTLMYSTISRGFRSGGIDDESLTFIETGTIIDGVQTQVTVDDITINPEFVTNYEFGIKADLLDGTLRWNSSAFYSDYTDIQVQTFDPILTDASGQAVQTLANGAEAEIYGFESEITYLPNDVLSFGVTVGYTKAEFEEFLDEDFSTGTLITTDRSEEAIGGPEWQASAWARYENNISSDIRAGAQINYSYRGSEELIGGPNAQKFPDQSQIELDSYGILNAQIDFDIESWGTNISFYGRNLTDSEHDTTGFALFTFQLPLAQRSAGAPRTYGIRVRKDF